MNPAYRTSTVTAFDEVPGDYSSPAKWPFAGVTYQMATAGVDALTQEAADAHLAAMIKRHLRIQDVTFNRADRMQRLVILWVAKEKCPLSVERVRRLYQIDRIEKEMEAERIAFNEYMASRDNK